MLMLADASGDLAAVELSNTRSGVRRPAAGNDWLLFTNVCHCPETGAVQVSESAAFSDKMPLPLRGKLVLAWHAHRARRLKNSSGGRVASARMKLAAIMADHGPSGIPDGTSPCVHTDYWRTTASLQWMPASRRVRFPTAQPAQPSMWRSPSDDQPGRESNS